MIVCEDRPGYPPDRTVRAGRRSRDSFRAAASRSSPAAVGCPAGVPGGGTGSAGRTASITGCGCAAGGWTRPPRRDQGFKRSAAAQREAVATASRSGQLADVQPVKTVRQVPLRCSIRCRRGSTPEGPGPRFAPAAAVNLSRTAQSTATVGPVIMARVSTCRARRSRKRRCLTG